ncbi:MAG: hypothetical protein ABSG32_27155 [Terriglobia bacterium]
MSIGKGRGMTKRLQMYPAGGGSVRLSDRLGDLFKEFVRTRACFYLLANENAETPGGLGLFAGENVQTQPEQNRDWREPSIHFLPTGKTVSTSSLSFLPVGN